MALLAFYTLLSATSGVSLLGGGPIALPGSCLCPWILSLPALGSYTIVKTVTHMQGSDSCMCFFLVSFFEVR